MKNIKPVFVACDHRVSEVNYRAAIAGVQEVLAAAAVESNIEVRSFGAWRSSEWRSNGALIPFQSVDWYVATGRAVSRREGQLECESILCAYLEEPWQRTEPHYDMMILSDDLYPRSGGEQINFVLGVSREDLGSVISTYRFTHSGLNERNAAECFKTTVMHELGHVFGLVSDERAGQGDMLHRRHCSPHGQCIMRQGMSVEEWALHTRDRLQHGPFCRECGRDLRAFFR